MYNYLLLPLFIFSLTHVFAQDISPVQQSLELYNGNQVSGYIINQTDSHVTVQHGANTYTLAKRDIVKRDGQYIIPEVGSFYSRPQFNVSVGSNLSFGDEVGYRFGLSYMFKNDLRNSFGIGIGYETYWRGQRAEQEGSSGDFIPVTVQWEHRFIKSGPSYFYTRLKIGYGFAINQTSPADIDQSGGLYGQLAIGRSLWSNAKYGIGLEGTLSYQNGVVSDFSSAENIDVDVSQRFIDPGISLIFSF